VANGPYGDRLGQREKSEMPRRPRDRMGGMGLAKLPVLLPVGGINQVTADLAPDEAPWMTNLRTPPGPSKDTPELVTRPATNRYDLSGHPASPVSMTDGWLSMASVIGGSPQYIFTDRFDLFAGSASATTSALTKVFDSVSLESWDMADMPDSTGTNRSWFITKTGNAQKMTGALAFSAWANNPPAGTMNCVWKQRMIIAGLITQPQRLFFSDIGNPESPSAAYGTNWIDIRADQPVTIVGIVPMGEVLFVLTNRGIWLVYDSNSFDNRQIFKLPVSSRAFSYDDRLYFSLARDTSWTSMDSLVRGGIYSFDNTGTDLEFESAQVNLVNEITGIDPVNGRLFFYLLPDTSNVIRGGGSIPDTVNDERAVFEMDLTRKNSRGNHPVFPWTHRPPTAGSGVDTPLVLFPSPYSGIGFIPQEGEIWRFNCGDRDGTAIDERNGAKQRVEFFKILGIQTEENIERLRRLNFYYQGRPLVEIEPESDHMWDWGPSSNQSDLLVNWTANSSEAFASSRFITPVSGSVFVFKFAKTKPETRGRWQTIRVSRDSGVNALKFRGNMEAVYRGGKES